MTPEERAGECFDAGTDPWKYGSQYVPNDMRERIADAIRAAVDAAVERCARVAEDRACFHRDNCPPTCKCADGWHIAIAIRSGSAAGGHDDE